MSTDTITFRPPRRVDLAAIDEGFAEAEKAYRFAEAGHARMRWAMVLAVRQILSATYRRAGLTQGGQA